MFFARKFAVAFDLGIVLLVVRDDGRVDIEYVQPAFQKRESAWSISRIILGVFSRKWRAASRVMT